MTLFDRESLYKELERRGFVLWSRELRRLTEDRFHPAKNGNLERWIKAWHELPVSERDAKDENELRRLLMQFHPWRKGPLHVLGIDIDTEWRSNLKWDRICGSVDFRDKSVLDVGCGNGYYGWRMLEEGADFVLGCDPYLLYVMQFEVVRRYASPDAMHFIVPLADTDLPSKLHAFDLTFSMGVLYHRTSPIDHLLSLGETLAPHGKLVLETLVIESDKEEVLVPEDRYAKMRNVWFIPSVPMLRRWLSRAEFGEIELIDISVTTTEEQRATSWMTFESLSDFLDPRDPSRTIEGYPSPVRAIVIAEK